MKVHEDPVLFSLNVDVGRSDVVVAEHGLLDMQSARFINLPRSGELVGVCETDVLALVMREIKVVPAQRVRDPVRHADQ